MALQPVEVLLRGEASGGRLALVEMAVPARSTGPPLHVHETWDEGFYVLEGELAVQVGDAPRRAMTGMFAFAPRGTPHTFANLGADDARILVVLTPAGFERYLETGERPPPNTRLVGPPIGGATSMEALVGHDSNRIFDGARY
jgi:quercetin dioxygenase-like cupin family protein